MHDVRVATMRQTARFPQILADLVEELTYKPGWAFMLADVERGQGGEGLTLIIRITAPDTNAPYRTVNVVHYLIVPAAAYGPESWRRWLFDQILLVEQHEAAEFFRIGGKQPFAPIHAPGWDPYQIFEPADETARLTTFRGEYVGDLSPEQE